MEEFLERSLQMIEQAGWLAPLFFILLHVFRQVFFVPVLFICLLGGYIFGTFYGSVYSVIGLTLVSIIFYGIIELFPSLRGKLGRLQEKILLGKHQLNIAQLMVLRMMPFVHFHVISIYLLKTTSSFRQYTKRSLLVSIPPAIVYTAFGDMIHELPLAGTIVFIAFLLILMLVLRKKETTISWETFFQKN
ncbi:TVP38/TMEM64 family protein [Bacillus sp. JCM 19034]|uniref:TVP38/TMEM64 family protein n=1 Tax=Bacillus sp. JCM 19034 TaxID=1481928 RepID=UPI00078045C8|nr:VTT domain-containing protein [Bacillus sp. JCM 19034]